MCLQFKLLKELVCVAFFSYIFCLSPCLSLAVSVSLCESSSLSLSLRFLCELFNWLDRLFAQLQFLICANVLCFNTEEEAIRDGKIKFKKPTKKGEDEAPPEKSETEQLAKSVKGKEKNKDKKKKEKEKKKPSLLSFDDEEDEEGWFLLYYSLHFAGKLQAWYHFF